MRNKSDKKDVCAITVHDNDSTFLLIYDDFDLASKVAKVFDDTNSESYTEQRKELVSKDYLALKIAYSLQELYSWLRLENCQIIEEISVNC
jgi:hypothetical protein